MLQTRSAHQIQATTVCHPKQNVILSGDKVGSVVVVAGVEDAALHV